MASDSILATLLAGTIGFDTTMSWLQLVVWGAYIGGTIWLYLKPAKNPAPVLVSK
jgi:high-affinity iron transporter